MPSLSRPAKHASGSKYGGSLRGAPGPAVSYSDLEAGILHAAIVTVTDNGDAITFGRTSEGGAYYVGILSEGTLEKFYLDSCHDAEERLRGVAGYMEP